MVNTLVSMYSHPQIRHASLMGCAASSTPTSYLAAQVGHPHISLPRTYIDTAMSLIWWFLRKPRYVVDLNEMDWAGPTVLQLADTNGYIAVPATLRANGAAGVTYYQFL